MPEFYDSGGGGRARRGKEVLNSAWTFRAAELIVQNASGERFHSALSFEGTAEARAARRLLKFRLGSSGLPRLVPRIDLRGLLMRFYDRLLDVPALDQHPMHHAADDEGGQHLA